MIREKTDGPLQLFLFSDEPDWVEKNFDTCGYDAICVSSAKDGIPQHDMHLMSLCKHHIIANSTFSWWGAWLGKNEGITCAPKKWFVQADMSKIYVNGWFVI